MLTDKQGGCTIVLYQDLLSQILIWWTKFGQGGYKAYCTDEYMHIACKQVNRIKSKLHTTRTIHCFQSHLYPRSWSFFGILGSTACNATPSSTHSPELFSSLSFASRHKLAQAMSSVSESDLLPNTPSFEETVDLMSCLTTPTGFCLIDMSILHTAVSWVQCPDCTAVDTLKLLEGAERQGLASKLVTRCYSTVYM